MVTNFHVAQTGLLFVPLRRLAWRLLACCVVGTIPTSICELPGLKGIYLDRNNLNGPIPSCISALTELTSLALWDNDLTGAPHRRDRRRDWRKSCVHGCVTSGFAPTPCPAPVSLSTKRNCHNRRSFPRVFLFSLACIVGNIPTSICGLTKLTGLFLDQNNLNGPIPSCIGSATSLVDVRLWQNELTGSIPTSVGALGSVKTFIVDHNNLVGRIPSEIGNLHSVTYLALHDNELTGPLPKSLGSLSDSMTNGKL